VHVRRAAAAATLAVCAWLAGGGAATAADSFRGTASAAAEKAAFSHGLAFWDQAKNRVVIYFLTRPLTPAERKTAIEDGLPSSVGNGAELILGLEEGAKTVDLASVDWTTLMLVGFVESPFSHNTTAADLGITALEGQARAGGPIKGVITGKTQIKGGGPAPIAYTWRLEFTATLSAMR
jgi:hypothetical protein